MKLIHCADIHLGSALSKNFTKQQAITRNEELLENFIKIMDYARDNSVRVVMISGDLFDTKNAASLYCDRVLEEIKRHSEVDFLYLCGNHDEAGIFGKRTLPANLKQFNGAGKIYRYGNVVITGINSLKLPDSLKFKEEDINIIMLHGQINNFNIYAGKNIDYMALGHIHKYIFGHIDSRGDYCYSGCIEGRGFDECGKKGFVLLDTQKGEKKKIYSEFIPFAKRTAWEFNIDVSKLSTTPHMYEKIKKHIKSIKTEDMISIILTGEKCTEAVYDVEYIKSCLAKEYYLVHIKDETKETGKISGFEAYLKEYIADSEETQIMKQEIIKCAEEVLNF